MTPESAPETAFETDDRFPSGPWNGFYLHPQMVSGRQAMELHLSFRKGVINGEGRDPVGKFLIVGRYEVSSGKCWWTKRYLGRHDVAYLGYNEGRGIWGTWELLDPRWRGGFHIWPKGMGDPFGADRAVEHAEEPVLVGVGAVDDSSFPDSLTID